MRNHQKPDRIIRAGGREFFLYKYFDDFAGEKILDYPDFNKNPEYTNQGRPFRLDVQESCAYGRDDGDPDDPDPGDCGGCVFFYREHTIFDPIGVCMCDALRQTPNEEKS